MKKKVKNKRHNFCKKMISMFLSASLVLTCAMPMNVKADSYSEVVDENAGIENVEMQNEAEVVFATNKYVNNTGKTYYIDADNGNDVNTGLSETAAWKTLTKMNATTFEPGDAILLKRGCTWTNTYVYPKGSGNAENRNYISCYGDEALPKPVIVSAYDDTAGVMPPYNTSVCLKEQQYWTIENIEVTPTNTSAESIVKITGTSSKPIVGIEIKNCTFTGGTSENWSSENKKSLAGITVSGIIKGILLEDNEVYNCKGAGITVNGNYAGCDYKGVINQSSGRNVVVRNNYLENIGTNGIFINNCFEPLVEYNVVNKSHSYAKNTACAGLWPFACYGALFQYNEAYNTRTIYDGQGFDCDYNCYYTTFQYNYSHNNVGGFMLICVEPDATWMPGGYAYNVGSTVRYNISQNDYHYIFTLTGAIEKTRIYNNTIYTDANSKDLLSGYPLTSYIFEFQKGVNKLNGLKYADDILIANNIFYEDIALNIKPTHCTNLVYKNNMHTGKKNYNGISNGQITYATDDKGNATEDICCKESSGNINGCDAGFVDSGKAGVGRDTCTGYYLYKDSKAIGAGVYIEDGYHPCNNDFFGNPIDKNSVNIGAYSGKGIARTTVYDSKYKQMIDFEVNKTGAIGKGEMGYENSGIRRCIASNGTPIIVESSTPYIASTNSKKRMMLKNKKDDTSDVYATFYIYPDEMKNTNGIRMYLDPDGRPTSFKITFKVTVDGVNKELSKTVTIKEKGWYNFTFAEKYSDTIVTPEIMRTMSELKVLASLPAGEYMYVDDIQINKGDVDKEIDTSIELESAINLNTITTFEGLENSKNSNIYGYKSSGPCSETPGITTYNGKKALYLHSESIKTTGVEFGYNWSESISALKNALKNSPSKYKGIQFNMHSVGYVKNSSGENEPLSEADMYMLSEYWNQFTVKIKSSNKLICKTNAGTDKEITEFKVSTKVDKNNILRVKFENLSTTYTENGVTYTIKLSSFNEEEINKWISGINGINFNYSTCGGRINKNINTYTYIYSIGLYEDINHTTSNWRVLKEKTCEEDGLREKVCTKCGTLIEKEVLKHEGHKLDVVRVEPTCIAKGSEYDKCKNCDYKSEIRVLNNSGHKIERIVTKKPTCKEDGEGKDVCSTCHEVINENIIFAKVDHAYSWKVITPATTKAKGTKKETCVYCDKVRATKTINMLGKISIAKTSYVYTGKTLKPGVSIKDSAGNKVSSAFYTITYTNNTKIGTAKIKIVFKGNYKGTVTKSFSIVPTKTRITSAKNTVGSKITVTWNKNKLATGYEIKYVVGKTAKTVKITSASILKKVFVSLKKGNTYKIQMRTYKTVNKKNYYSAWSDAKSVKVVK